MRKIRWHAIAFLMAAVIVAFLFLFRTNGTANAADSATSAPYTTWEEYGGSPDSAQYSALTQINKSNVTKLKQVWFYPAGNNGFRYGSNPIVIDNAMYVIGKDNNIAALDATTGKELWVHDNQNPRGISHRGITYWESKDRADRRIFFTANNMLHAIDARTGKDIDTFGDHGSVDLRVGLGRDPKTVRQIESGTPGRIFENLLLLGSATGEEYESPPGDLRAYNVVTGKLVWTFHTVPHPGEMGYETWPKDAWKYIGGTNDWGEISIDEKRGIAYFPLGSPTYDFYGADRHGMNLFSDCLLALDARTGKYLWHYQTTHHDLWDYDLEAAPKLLTVQHDGKMVDVVAEAGKNGFVYVLDRVTGKPIWPIEERPVPKSTMPEEQAWPTQPYPTVIPPFARQKFAPDEVSPYIADPKEREAIRAQVAAARSEGLYTPAGLSNTMEIPGNNGGANWGSTAIDPTNGTFYVVSKDAPSLIKLEQKRPSFEMRGTPETQGQLVYIQNCQSCHMMTLKGQPPAIPSMLNIIDRIGEQRVRTTVQNGAAPMPAFPDLSPAQLNHLIAYLAHPENGHLPPQLVTRLLAPPPARLAPTGTRYWTGYGYMNSTEDLPSIAPPWSTLTAYNLNNGSMKWQVPLGGVTRLLAEGIKDTGSYWPRGGGVVTASGLIFIGTQSDSTVHAYDENTGKVVWEAKIAGGPEGIPAVYEVGGKEYIAFSASYNTGVTPNGEVPIPEMEMNPHSSGKTGPPPAPTQGYYVFALSQ